MRVRISDALPYEATDHIRGDKFMCHCVRISDPDMLLVSAWLWERIESDVLKVDPGRSLEDVMAGVFHDCDLWRGPGRWERGE